MKKSDESRRASERRRTQGRRAEDRLLPNFQELVDGSQHGILIHSNFKPLYANDAFASLFGFANAEDVMQLPLLRSLIPPEQWARAEEDYHQLIRGEKTQTIGRVRFLRKDGGELWTLITQRVIDWHGQPAIYLTALDVSTQTKVEQTMLDNEQRLRSMLEILPVAIFIARWEDSKLLFVNRKTCLLFQQSAGPLLRSTAVSFYPDPQDRENIRTLLQTVQDVREIEVKMKTAQGREFIAELAATMIHYAGVPAVMVAVNDITQRKQLESKLQQQANTDELTGIDNRRYFFDQAEQEMRRARRFNRELSVLMIDLDHFKKINDTLGHAVGDLVLQGVVKAIKDCLRNTDIVGRLGGEEFAAILPESGTEAAKEAATRMCQYIAKNPIVTEKATVPCTVSIGLAQMDARDHSIDQLLQRADEALYRAKHNGRNRFETAN